MGMQRAKKNQDKKKIIIGIVISLLLIGTIIVTVVLKNQQANDGVKVEQNEAQQQNDKDKSEVDEPKEKEQPNKPDELDNNEQAKQDNEVPKVQPDSNGYIPGQKLPAEPTFVDGILIASKKYPLPSTYAPGESAEARAAFEKMANAAKSKGFILVPFSGYRSYEYQTTLYNNYVNRDGKEAADRYSARPGYSEHQTGLSFDIGEKGKEDVWLTEEFGETPAGKWLAAHAHEYGFHLRYPKGKEAITGYMYESWHFRYLGVDTATAVYKKGVTLEEYLGIN